MAKLRMKARKEVIERQEKAYKKATKKGKSAILTYVCETTGLSRDRAQRLLKGKPSGHQETPKTRSTQQRRGRRRKYGAKEAKYLEKIWAYMGNACGKLIVRGIGDMLDALIRHGEWDADSEVTEKLRGMSASTMDRLLKATKEAMRFKGKSTTKPGTMLKKNIPTRLGSQWDEDMPGYMEIDLVAHCGSTTAGDYINTLDATDINTGWTESVAVPNKAQRHVFAGVKQIRGRLPFELRGIDSDNGSEFINAILYRYCCDEGIVFTRSRPNRKNDNCHVEQKNWHIVRRNIGYCRYEGEEAVVAINDYYSLLRLQTNFFLPQAKLVSKTRDGARVTKKYDTPKTPCQRALNSAHVGEEAKKRLRAQLKSLNPAAIVRGMAAAMEKLAKLAMPQDGSPSREAPKAKPQKPLSIKPIRY